MLSTGANFHNMPYGTTLTGETLNWTVRDYQIADVMSRYWINFISTGDPNGGNLTTWEPSGSDSKNTMLLGDGWGTINVASDDTIDFVEDFFEQEIAW